MTFNRVPNKLALVNTSLTDGSCNECWSPSGSKRVSHPRQTVAHDLPVHSGFGINSDSFFTILIAPSVSSESKVTHTRGCSLDALVQLVVGVGYGFRQGKAVTNG
jgi:hypothetical protein